MLGPSFLPVKLTVTCLRVAVPPSACLSQSNTSQVMPSGRPGLRPNICVRNSSRISGRRLVRHVSASVTLSPLAMTSGSGRVYAGTLASS